MNKYENRVIQEDMKVLKENEIDFWKLNNKTILFTGATGMLASYMVYFLIYLNENIEKFNCNIALIARSKEKCDKRFGEHINKKYFKIYLCSLEEEILIPEKIDYIVHAASIAITQYFEKNPIGVALPNSLGTYRLLELACKNNVESFLFFSTGSIYGKINNKKMISEQDYGILDPLDTNSCYSESKRFGEMLCKSYWKQRGVKSKIIRITHTYGPTIDLENDERVFSEFIKNILNGQDIEVKSDGRAVRSFCYISDATEAFFKVLLDGENGDAYNLSNVNANISIGELAKILIDMYNDKKIKLKFLQRNTDKYVENKFANEIAFSTRKLEKINWKAKVSIENGFRRTIESFEEN